MNMLALTIILPLIGFVLLAFSRGRWSENVSAIVGVGSVGLAALVTAFIGVDFFANGEQAYSQPLWTWMSVGDFNIGFNLVLDGLSLTMLSVVTGVGFLIHMYASWYMRGEEGYSRFFAYTNLFIASMVVLVLADNLLLMYLGWEGVGLCSYLLIGFYYTDPKNGAAAMKAFVVTRVGDVFLAFALFILYNELGTLNFREMVELAPAHFADGNNMLMWATLMLLGGAVGKSAQLPLQTWLADAMAGPTPVSALIHAATMVTAGVYLIARTHGLFLMTPEVLHLVGIVGAVTLLLAGFAALVQTDIKRVLAYSTMSQIGYMFLALGVQAWDAAIFHLMTHAFFKALLPLIVLLILSTFVGALIVPPLQGVLPQTTELAHGSMLTLEITSGVVAVVGILLAAWLWLGKRTLVTSIANSAPGRLLGTWWYNAWGFDWLYDKVFVKPFLGIAWLLKRDPLNSMMNIPAVLSRFAGKGLLLSENGYLRWYVASMSIGAVVVLALLMVLR